jgi:hypothetical protein
MSLRFHLTQVRKGYPQNNEQTKITNASNNMEKMELLCPVVDDLKWHSHCGEQHRHFLKN